MHCRLFDTRPGIDPGSSCCRGLSAQDDGPVSVVDAEGVIEAVHEVGDQVAHVRRATQCHHRDRRSDDRVRIRISPEPQGKLVAGECPL